MSADFGKTEVEAPSLRTSEGSIAPPKTPDTHNTLIMAPDEYGRRRKKGADIYDQPIHLDGRCLHEVLNEQHLTKLHNIFLKEETGKITQSQLEKILREIAKLEFDEAEIDLVFRQINIQRDGLITWDDFISYLILGFKNQEVGNEFVALDSPICKKPIVVKSNHRHPINCISFCHQVKPDRTCSYSDGSYITSSKDGFLNYWSLDLQVERTVISKCPDLNVTDTWVLSVVCLADVSVVCTSSTERDLRFFDTSARKFELRVMISSLDFGVYCMHYVFQKDINEESKLICGDMGGNIIIIIFSPINRGPFRSKPGIPLLQVVEILADISTYDFSSYALYMCKSYFSDKDTEKILKVLYEKVAKGLEPGFRVVEFKRQHSDWVRQVEYYPWLNFIVSCSVCPKSAIVMRDINENRGIYSYKITKGAWCIAVADGAPLIASGGPDCLVRVWNPYVTKRPLVVFHGHHTGVISLILQDHGEILCSLSEDRCIKIWDTAAQCCVQTYLGIPSEVGEHTALVMFYNPESRQILLGGHMLAVLSLRSQQNGEHTDGNSHSLAISVVLYNPLFKIILTCGLDSFIIVWDPWTGRRMSVVRQSHTRLLHGEHIPVEITAACFDPGNQMLLTGAHDGSLKTWNFNTGTCLRNMHIEVGCEITGVVWIKGRILAIGWNRHVTEFADSGGAAGPGGAFSKSWGTRHTEDVLCTAARVPQTLATSTYNGELVLWRLETGQPYKQYSVADPTGRIKMNYNTATKKTKATKTDGEPSTGKKKKVKKKALTEDIKVSSSMQLMKGPRKQKGLAIPTTVTVIRGQAVRCMLFLSARPMIPKCGSLLLALENGDLQIWSHHAQGGYITAFQAVHNVGDYIVAMATDEYNEFLFTGSTEGYIKTFLMKNFAVPEEITICMPKYRLIFPFLWRTLIDGRAKRALRDQVKPLLLNSYRAHRDIISGLTYIDPTQTLVSCSADYSVRLWTIGGRYLGTLGSFKPWIPISPDFPPPKNHVHKIPPDIQRVMSSTTYRVFMGEDIERRLTRKQEAAKAEKEMTVKDFVKGVYGKRLEDPILGHYFAMQRRSTQLHEFTLDTTFPHIPVYQHLVRPAPAILIIPSSPAQILSNKYSKTTGPQKSNISLKSTLSKKSKKFY